MPGPTINARNGYRGGAEDRATFQQNTQRGLVAGTVQPLFQQGFQPQNSVNSSGEVVVETVGDFKFGQRHESQIPANITDTTRATGVTVQQAPAVDNPLLQTRFQEIVGGLKSKWQGVDKTSAANTALGIAGGLRYLNASQQQPHIDAPGKLYSQRPVHNYAGMRMQGMQTNADAQAGATRQLQHAAGADINAYVSGQQAMLSNRLKADGQVNQTIDGYQRQDAQAAAELANSDARYNFETQRSYQEAMYNNQVADRRAQMQEGQQMLQGAVNYGLQKRADDQQYAERLKQQEGNMRLEGFREEMRHVSGIADATQQATYRDQVYKRYGYNPRQFQQGFNGQVTN